MSITSCKTYVHNELAPARIKEDAKAVEKLVDLLEEYSAILGQKTLSSPVCLTGIATTAEVSNDLLQAREKERRRQMNLH